MPEAWNGLFNAEARYYFRQSPRRLLFLGLKGTAGSNLDADTQVLLGGDLGCLLNMAGKLQRQGLPVRVYHTAEVLAGKAEIPPIAHRK